MKMGQHYAPYQAQWTLKGCNEVKTLVIKEALRLFKEKLQDQFMVEGDHRNATIFFFSMGINEMQQVGSHSSGPCRPNIILRKNRDLCKHLWLSNCLYKNYEEIADFLSEQGADNIHNKIS